MTITEPGVYRDRRGEEHRIVWINPDPKIVCRVESDIGDTWALNGRYFASSPSICDLVERIGDLP